MLYSRKRQASCRYPEDHILLGRLAVALGDALVRQSGGRAGAGLEEADDLATYALNSLTKLSGNQSAMVSAMRSA